MARPKKSAQAPVPVETKIIVPVVKDSHSFHPLETAEAKGELPELTSIGMCRVGETNTFVSYVITSRGDKVISVEVSEPDLKAIAIETTKIEFVNKFIDDPSGVLQ
jgi:hypothetical protein